MYKIATYVLIIFSTLACQNNAMNNQNSLPEALTGDWVLEGIEAPNPAMQGDFSDMDYREYYTFNKDGTFTKSREDGMKAKGSVSITETEDGTYYVLNYSDNTPYELISSCLEGEESFKLEGDKLVNDIRMCDGPRYTYARQANEE